MDLSFLVLPVQFSGCSIVLDLSFESYHISCNWSKSAHFTHFTHFTSVPPRHVIVAPWWPQQIGDDLSWESLFKGEKRCAPPCRQLTWRPPRSNSPTSGCARSRGAHVDTTRNTWSRHFKYSRCGNASMSCVRSDYQTWACSPSICQIQKNHGYSSNN
jgi:hypothetical protein